MSSMENKFLDKINSSIHQKGHDNRLLSKDKVDSIINLLSNFDQIEKKEKIAYYYNKQYEVFNIGDSNVLCKKGTIQRIMPIEGLFDVLQSAHAATGHGGRDAMAHHISTNFSNVTREEISVFLSLCEQCVTNKARVRKSIVVKPILSDEMNSRAQVDLIDYQSQPDGEYKFVLNYQDHLTKFVFLKPLKTKTAVETAENILEIFCITGAPLILQSDNGAEFRNQVMREIVSTWKECKIVHEKPRHSQSQGSVERSNRNIQDKLAKWLDENKTTKWTKGLKFVQFQKNSSFHRGIGRTPYEALFGSKPKLGLQALNFPGIVTDNIHTEEHLENALNYVKASPEEDTGEIQIQDVSESDNVCVTCEENVKDKTNCAGCSQSVHGSLSCSKEDPDSLEPMLLCLICWQKTAINEHRVGSRRKMEIQATKMTEESIKRFKQCEIGEPVLVPVPQVDRAKTDLRNVKAVVLSNDDGYYQLGTKVGKLKSLYTRNQFFPSPESFVSPTDVPKKEITLRSAAIALSVGTGQRFFKCDCKTKCQTDRCKCRKHKVLWNSKCHL